MSLARTHIVDPALPDGNCAFNAFALGLCKPELLSQINLVDNNPFVQASATAFGVIPVTWDNLKTILLRKSRKSKVELQQTLAPILRRLSFEMIVNHPESKTTHLTETSEAIQAELEGYLKKPDTQTGDIFIRHNFIKNKFKDLHLQYGANSEQAKKALIAWWEKTGHANFLKEMAIPASSAAETNRYAGDLELAPLGAFFGINLRVHSPRRGFNVQMHNANGSLPRELISLVRELADRNIIENQSHYWKDLTEADLQKRLGPVPQLNELKAIFSAPSLPIRGKIIPGSWTRECKNQLYDRGIIDKQDRYLGVPANNVITRISEQANKDKVVAAWKKHYKIAPTISLENQSATHWNALIEQPELSAQVNPLGTRSRSLTPINFGTKPANSTVTSSALSPKSATSSTSATTSLVSYKPSAGEKEVNDALMEAFELLDKNRANIGDDSVKRDFENLFDYFQKQLTHYDPRLFAQAKQRTLKNVEQQVQALLKHPLSS